MCRSVIIRVQSQGPLSDVLGVDLTDMGYTGDLANK